jgi:hypothetical protein
MTLEDEITEIKKKLAEHDKRIQQLEKIPVKEIKLAERLIGSKNGLTRLPEKAGVSEENIKKVYDLEHNSFTIVKIFGEDDREKTKNTTLLVLLGYKYIFGNDEVLSQEIRRNVAENKIPLDNFSTHLKQITPSLIRRKGKMRSPKTTYRLTTLGEANAKDLLKKTCTG